MKQYYVYILSNWNNEVVYVGVTREKRIKTWQRNWKDQLVEKDNPQWCDLYDNL